MVKHPKTHINQINKDQTQRTNIKSSKGETTNNTQGDLLSIKTLQPEGNGRTYLSDEREKPDYYTEQGSHSNIKEKSKALQTTKS